MFSLIFSKVTFAEKDETLYSSVTSEEEGSPNNKNSSTGDASQGQVQFNVKISQNVRKSMAMFCMHGRVREHETTRTAKKIQRCCTQ